MATLVLFSTVLASMGLGVLAAGWVVNAILYAFGSHAQQEPTPMLIPSQTHASGD